MYKQTSVRKARLVANSFVKKEGIDFDETFKFILSIVVVHHWLIRCKKMLSSMSSHRSGRNRPYLCSTELAADRHQQRWCHDYIIRRHRCCQVSCRRQVSQGRANNSRRHGASQPPRRQPRQQRPIKGRSDIMRWREGRGFFHSFWVIWTRN